jgi:hypothetical protein
MTNTNLWKVTVDGYSLDGFVYSLSFFNGKKRWLENYSPQTLSLTINNSTNLASAFLPGSEIKVYRDGIGTNNNARSFFYTQSVSYDDGFQYASGGATATITAIDLFGVLSREQLTNADLGDFNCLAQLSEYTPLISFTSDGNSIAVVTDNYTGTIGARLAQNMQTEHGIMINYGDTIKLLARSQVGENVSTLSFGGTASATVLPMNAVFRSALGDSFNNVVTVDGPWGPFTATNAAGVALWGTWATTTTQVDGTSGQAQASAEYLAALMGDALSVNQVYFEIHVMDYAVNPSTLTLFMQYNDFISQNIDVVYRIPGTPSDTTYECVIEGLQINSDPQKTEYVFYLTPAELYRSFILDDAIFGTLDNNRLSYGDTVVA